jgi:preprotein translocase subunit SecF
MDFIKNWLSQADFDFVGKRRIAAIASSLMVLGSFVVFFAIGPNYGIDFTGGTEIHLKFDDQITIGDVRGVLRQIELGDDAVQAVGATTDYEFKVRIQDTTFGSDELRQNVEEALVASFGPDWMNGEPRFSAEVGAQLTVAYNGDEVRPDRVYEALTSIDNVVVEEGREDSEIVVKLPPLSAQIEGQIRSALGGRDFEVLGVDSVGPKVGGELRRQAFISLMATLGLVLLYIAFRFDLSFAPGAVAALAHDVLIVVGIFVAMGREFNLPMIGALLTIVGYSLNDTIVIYDRIRENRDRYRASDLPNLINRSVNETLARTVATSVTTFLAISAFLFLGGPVIQNFALAMVLGVVFGTYSTVFVASPMILVMEDLKPYLQTLIVSPDGDDEGMVTGPEDIVGPMTEAERRRRERAALQQDPSRRGDSGE